jgi:hypothetical protein
MDTDSSTQLEAGQRWANALGSCGLQARACVGMSIDMGVLTLPVAQVSRHCGLAKPSRLAAADMPWCGTRLVVT